MAPHKELLGSLCSVNYVLAGHELDRKRYLFIKGKDGNKTYVRLTVLPRLFFPYRPVGGDARGRQ